MNILLGICAVVCMASPVGVECYVNNIDLVRSSACGISGDSIIVAIVSKPIYLKSERETFMLNVAKMVSEEYGFSKVIVSLDSDIYVKLLSASDSASIEKLQNLAIKRGGSYEYNRTN